MVLSANMSGDVFECEIGWKDHDATYNATYQIFANGHSSETKSESNCQCRDATVYHLFCFVENSGLTEDVQMIGMICV